MAKYPTLLLIDDDEDDRDIFAIALKTAEPEAKLITSANGPDALQKLADGLNPDFIFVDLNMPYMHGIECLEEIKQIAGLKNVPAVMYTTSSNRKDVENAQNAGAAYFLVKPTSLSVLSNILENIMQGTAATYFIEAVQ
jgi:CheY-like chemotaxis protein